MYAWRHRVNAREALSIPHSTQGWGGCVCLFADVDTTRPQTPAAAAAAMRHIAAPLKQQHTCRLGSNLSLNFKTILVRYSSMLTTTSSLLCPQHTHRQNTTPSKDWQRQWWAHCRQQHRVSTALVTGCCYCWCVVQRPLPESVTRLKQRKCDTQSLTG